MDGASASDLNNTYIIDIEKQGAETSRLLLQDQVFTNAMGGLFPPHYDLSGVSRILDVACGPGRWALDVAYEHPQIEVVGIDISQTMITYAQTQAQIQGLTNISFHVMDAKSPLAFPDEHFDFINARLLLGFMAASDWPPFLQECFRLLTPGGHLRWTEAESGLTNSPACERYTRLIAKALYLAGQSVSPDGYHLGIIPAMLPFLRAGGYVHIRHDAYALDGSFGTPGYESGYQNTKIALKLVQPFLIRLGVATEEEIEALYQQAVRDYSSPTFYALGYVLSAWGQKPSVALP